MKLPKRLEHQPLVETLLEIRIGGAEQPMADVLPGLVFSQMSGLFSRTEALPLASIPRLMREKEENLRFKAHHRLIGDKFVLSVGDHVIALSRMAPYGGWEEFRETLHQVIDVVESADLVDDIVRFSMKSLNVIPQFTDRQLDMVRINVALNDQPLPDRGFRLRTETKDEQFIRIIEIAPNAHPATRLGGEFKGLQLNVDCIREIAEEDGSWDLVRGELEELHSECKRLFFSLLTDDTLEALGPEYDD